MKKNLRFLSLTLVLTVIAQLAGAQLLLEENFNYTAGDPLVKGAVNSSSNSETTVTGWLTMSNSTSGTNSFTIAAEGLTYPGYPGSGVGKAVEIIDNNGQDVFKTFSSSNTVPSPGASFPGPKTIYIAYLIKVPAEAKDGAEFFAGIKYSNSATDANYFGRTFAKVSGNSVQFGITKSTTPCNSWSAEFPVNKTHLLILKYEMGGLNGTTVTEETGKYDDKVALFINPALGTAEPAPTLTYANAADRDAYRYSSNNSLIGGLAALYFRTPGEGAIPAATIDGIRIANTWAEAAASVPTGLPALTDNQDVRLYMDNTIRSLRVDAGDHNFNRIELYSVSGIKVLDHTIHGRNFTVNMNQLDGGVYIVRLKGFSDAYASRIIVH